MKMSVDLTLVILWALTFLSPPISGQVWNYRGDNAPPTWPDTYPMCGGLRQSPINIEPRKAVPKNMASLFLGNYEVVPEWMTMKNEAGHSIVVSMDNSVNKARVPYVSKGPLNSTFRFLQLHFHWGSNSYRGSEHTIAWRKYPMEMHLVHYNTLYANATEAGEHNNGILVVAFLFNIQNYDNPAFNELISTLTAIREPEEKADVIEPFSLQSLLPDKFDSYFYYQGSLTTPPCLETVNWIIYRKLIGISERQLRAFRWLHNGQKRRMADNFRPLQPLNGRRVFVRLAKSDGDLSFIFAPKIAVPFVAALALATGAGVAGVGAALNYGWI